MNLFKRYKSTRNGLRTSKIKGSFGPQIEHLESRRLMAVTAGDFDGDGTDDMVVGLPGAAIGNRENAGRVEIVYGGDNGLATNDDPERWDQLGSIKGTARSNDRFGAVLATGDFNNDGADDLAIGSPDDDIHGIRDAGSVNVIYGRRDVGLQLNDNQIWHQSTWGIADRVERFDHFGAALAVGDFNDDDFEDLAIGIPGESVTPEIDLLDQMRGVSSQTVLKAGAVTILYGSARGLKSAESDFLYQHEILSGVSQMQEYDNFGAALAAADFDNNGADDLAIGVPGKDVESAFDAGAVNVVYGTVNGFKFSLSDTFHQDTEGIGQRAHAWDYFGSTLTAGYFDGQAGADLAIGVPDEDLGGEVDAGLVHVLYGSDGDGLSPNSSVLIHQNRSNITGPAVGGNRFGAALAAGNFDFYGHSDLAIGIPGHDVGDAESPGYAEDAGAVVVVFARNAGLANQNSWILTQDSTGVAGNSNEADGFGTALAAGHFDGNSTADLVIGTPGESIGESENAGAVNVLYSEGSVAAIQYRRWFRTDNDIVWKTNDPQSGDSAGGTLHSDSNPEYQSQPGAPVHLYLDFDGGYSFRAGDTPPFDIDGREDSVNRRERELIRDIWEYVAEDFAPFRINVTTVHPSHLAANSDAVKRVAIGGHWNDWYGENIPGVSKIGAFTDGSPGTIPYVFTEPWLATGKIAPAYSIANTASHEAGHAYGLEHKSDYRDIDPESAWVEVAEYSNGDPNGDWEPIMGAGPHRRRAIWTQAEEEVIQIIDDEPVDVTIKGSNDLGILSRHLAYRPDDYGDSVDEAKPLDALTLRESRITKGIIGHSLDEDVFTFQVEEQGALSVEALVNQMGPNLNARFILTGPGIDGFLTADSDDLDASITDLDVEPGEYTIEVDSRDQKVGSIGQYTLRVELAPIIPKPWTIDLSSYTSGNDDESDSITLSKQGDELVAVINDDLRLAKRLDRISSVDVIGTDDDEYVTFDMTGLDLPHETLSVLGNKGRDFLDVIDGDNSVQWQIDGVNSGTANGLTFNGVEDLGGSPSWDLFTIRERGKVSSIDGGVGIDTLQVVSGAKDVHWDVTANNEGTIRIGDENLVDQFTSVGLLVGSDSVDHFIVLNGSALSMGIKGEGGRDRLRVEDAAGEWRLDGRNRGQVSNMWTDQPMAAFESIEHLTGGRYEDRFYVGINKGVDGRIDGGEGTDWLDYSTTYDTGGVRVNLETGEADGIGEAGFEDSVLGIENVKGTRFDDVIKGDDGPNILLGDAGVDLLMGAAGNDELHGGDDDDVLLGGDDVDRLFGDNGRDVLDGGNDGHRDQLVGGLQADTFVRYVQFLWLDFSEPFSEWVEDDNLDFDALHDRVEDHPWMPA